MALRPPGLAAGLVASTTFVAPSAPRAESQLRGGHGGEEEGTFGVRGLGVFRFLGVWGSSLGV